MSRLRDISRVWMGLSIFLGIALVGCENAHRLKLNLKKGTTYAQKVHLISDMKMPPFPGADYQDSLMVLRYKVIDVDEQQAATVRVTIESIKASMKSLTVSASFDSDKHNSQFTEKRPSEIPQRFRRCFAELKGAGYSALVDQEGQVIKVFDIDQSIERVSAGLILDEMAGGHQAALLLSPNHLREYVALGMCATWSYQLPQVDQSWVSLEPAETPRALPVMVKKTFKVDEIKKENGAHIAVVSFKTVGALKQPLPEYAQLKAQGARSEVAIKAITGQGGKVTFNLNRGRLIRFEEQLVAEINFPGVQTSRPPATQDQTQRPERKIHYVIDKTIEYLDKK